MRFITLATLFTAALATPLTRRSTEVVWTNDAGLVRNHDDSLASASFTLHTDAAGDSFGCSTGANANPSLVDPKYYPCDKEGYSFRFIERVTYGRFKFSIVHQTSAFAGLMGNMTIGCNGSNFISCSQVGKASTTLCSDLTKCGDVSDN